MKRAGRTRIAAVLAVGALAAVAGGCGGGGGGGGGHLSKAAYQAKLRSVGQDLNGLASIGTSSGSASSKFDQLRAGLRKAADNLAKVSPPSDAKADNDRLVSGLRELANDLGPVEQAAMNKDLPGLQAALRNLQSSGGVTKIRDAINDLRSKGYGTSG